MIAGLNPKMGGEYFRFPFWGKGRLLNNDPDPDRKFVTVHPLSGCIMGGDSGPVTVNPTLSIVAMAALTEERASRYASIPGRLK